MGLYDDALQTGSTTLCRCFRLTRADGTVMGFTDHDEDVSFDGLTHVAGAALTATEASAKLGLAPDEMEASGALSDEAITESDVVAGVYDGAAVEVWDVNWADTAVRKLLGRYTIGEVERGGLGFRAELRSMAATIDRPEGRVHTTLCDARRLGDARCRLNLAGWQGAGTVTAVEGLSVTVSGLDGFANGFFSRGICGWSSGANSGDESDVRLSTRSGALTILSLWRKPGHAIEIGDTVTVVAGCDRTADTCKTRFANLVNFRGFPHMPGESFLRERGREGDPNQTGGSRFV